MKIKVKSMPYTQVLRLPKPAHKKPKRPALPVRALLRMLSGGEVKAAHTRFSSSGMDRLPADEPCLILMNHSSFLDLKLAAYYFYPKPLSIVCTSDGFVGKEPLMRALGCIPTQKFVADPLLIRDMAFALHHLRCSVLMFPEASYTFDGTATPLPESLGGLLKLLKVPVVSVITHGSFARDPLYNGLQKRRADVSAEVRYLFSPEEIAAATRKELNERLGGVFTFDQFRWQYENHIVINEPFRADGLNRVLYKCPRCRAEGKMSGKGTRLVCEACGKAYQLDELGRLQAEDGETEFVFVPDWYAWERREVRAELERGEYRLELDVDICVMTDYKAIYRVGGGRLTHDAQGFLLCGDNLRYEQSPTAAYSLYADYYWYELGDMICIGTNERLYYCFPKNGEDVVAKTRLACEELYKLKRSPRP